jgi:hypothetical protein
VAHRIKIRGNGRPFKDKHRIEAQDARSVLGDKPPDTLQKR